MLKNFIDRIVLPLIIFTVVIIFLWFCPPPAGKYKFNLVILLSAMLCFFYGLIFRDFTISGLLITAGNGLTRFSLVSYPTVSFLNCCLFLGYILSIKSNNEKLFIRNFNNNGVISSVIIFWLINLLSAGFHILVLTRPGIVFVVNRAGMLNVEIVYHIVGYVLFPLTCGILLFLLMLNTVEEKKVEKFLNYSATGCILSSVVGILQATGVIKGIFGYVLPCEPRVNGLFSDFNSFSLSLGLLLPMFCFYFFHVDKISKKILFFTSVVLGSMNLFLTGTRSGILLVGLFTLFYLFFLLLGRKYKQVLTLIMCVVVLFLLLKIFGYQKVSKFYGMQRLISYFSVSLDTQIQERKIFWTTGIKMWQKNVLTGITGNGIKSMYREFSNINPPWGPSDNACNTYIHYIAEIGIVGLIAFVSVIILILFFTGNSILKLVVLSFLIASFFGHHIESEEVNLIFWCYLGMMADGVQLKNSFIKVVKLFNLSLLIFFSVVSFLSFVNNYKNLDIFKYNVFAGLYKPEQIENRQVFWTDRFVLAKVAKVTNKKISFLLNSGGVKNQKVKIFFDNEKNKEIELPEREWISTTVIVPQECDILKIIPERTFIPAGRLKRYLFPFNGKDYRRLGVMLSFI